MSWLFVRSGFVPAEGRIVGVNKYNFRRERRGPMTRDQVHHARIQGEIQLSSDFSVATSLPYLPYRYGQ